MRSIGLPELLIVFVIFTALSGWLAAKQDRNWTLWAVLGFITGPFALLVLIIASAFGNGKVCPFCRKRIDRQASKCPYCQSVLEPVAGSR